MPSSTSFHSQKRISGPNVMAKMTTDSPCCEGDDWLVVGCDDGSRESAASGPQSEANSTETRDKRGLEASQGENQILDSDQHSEDEKLKANVSEKEPHGEQESDTSQTTAKKQDRNIFQVEEKREREVVLGSFVCLSCGLTRSSFL